MSLLANKATYQISDVDTQQKHGTSKIISLRHYKSMSHNEHPKVTMILDKVLFYKMSSLKLYIGIVCPEM